MGVGCGSGYGPAQNAYSVRLVLAAYNTPPATLGAEYMREPVSCDHMVWPVRAFRIMISLSAAATTMPFATTSEPRTAPAVGRSQRTAPVEGLWARMAPPTSTPLTSVNPPAVYCVS